MERGGCGYIYILTNKYNKVLYTVITSYSIHYTKLYDTIMKSFLKFKIANILLICALIFISSNIEAQVDTNFINSKSVTNTKILPLIIKPINTLYDVSGGGERLETGNGLTINRNNFV